MAPTDGMNLTDDLRLYRAELELLQTRFNKWSSADGVQPRLASAIAYYRRKIADIEKRLRENALS